MNERIRSHFDEIEARLIECPVIRAYQINRRDISLDDGKLRIKSALTGEGVFECFLYLKDTGHSLYPLKFSFHWQDAEGKTVRRLDNAPHHTGLPYAPNHLHIGADCVEGFAESPDIFAFIDNMEGTILEAIPQ